MKYFRDQPAWKLWITGVLALVLLIDAILITVSWQSGAGSAAAMRENLGKLQIQAKLLKADVNRGQAIKAHFPDVGKECDDFYKQQLLPAPAGYSGVISDLGSLAEKAGLKTGGMGFSQKDVKDRGVTEVDITAEVEGSYSAVIGFINGLEHSKNFYLLHALELDTSSSGIIRLKLGVATYFRT
jgi:Tfp pilus assembly protein PilO